MNGPTVTPPLSSTDDADGTDGIFGTRPYRDDSRFGPALTRESDLHAERLEDCLRPPQSTTSECPRILAHATAIETMA